MLLQEVVCSIRIDVTVFKFLKDAESEARKLKWLTRRTRSFDNLNALWISGQSDFNE